MTTGAPVEWSAQLAADLSTYADDPVGFTVDFFGKTPWKRQVEMMEKFRDRKRVSCRSGHGAGKTDGLCYLIGWKLLTQPGVKICVTAPTFRQLTNVVFRRLIELINASPLKDLFICKATKVEVALPYPMNNYAFAATARNPEGLQGLHAEPEFGAIVVIIEEASGVGAEFFEALEGATSTGDSYILMVGNPTRLEGKFYDSHNKDRAAWHTMRVSAEESPLVSKEWIEERKAIYGEDSDVYRIRVLGEFPRVGGDCLIPLQWLEDAIVVTEKPHERLVGKSDGYVIGIDPARGGSDSTAVMVRRGHFILAEYIRKFRGLATTEVAGYAMQIYTMLQKKSPTNQNTGAVIQPLICVEAVGIGAGVFDNLKLQGANVREVQAAEVAPDTFPKCHRNRDWLYWQTRELFNPESGLDPIILVPKGNSQAAKLVEQMISECSALMFRYLPDGAVAVEKKEDYKKRNSGRSPDLADSLAVSFARENRNSRKKVVSIFDKARRRKAANERGWVV